MMPSVRIVFFFRNTDAFSPLPVRTGSDPQSKAAWSREVASCAVLDSGEKAFDLSLLSKMLATGFPLGPCIGLLAYCEFLS